MNQSNIYVAIMAGGVGSRFWPGSREARPKQFLDMLGVGKSLLRMTFERFLPLCPAERILIVTNEQYRDLVKEHIPEISDNQIIGEPSRNNTAPSVAFTALKLHDLNPDANFVMAASDHVVLKEDIFLDKIRQALDFTEKNDALVTLGITPTRPDTGYGYIRFGSENIPGVHQVEAFLEKPNLQKAQEFLASGQYLWNAGIFIWSAKSILTAFGDHAPDILEQLATSNGSFNTDKERAFMAQQYPGTRSVAVDVAIMEKAKNVFTIPADFGWSDLGTWASLYDYLPKDEAHNVVLGNAAITQDATNTFVRMGNPDKLAIIRGLENFIIVDESDVLLIYPKDKEQEIKEMGKIVTENFGQKFS